MTVLGIGQNDVAPPPVQSAEALARIAHELDLDLVYWCRCARASWDSPRFRQLLLGSDG